MNKTSWIIPDWPVPPHVKTLISCRQGGVSQGPYSSLNMGLHVGDKISAVHQNRLLLKQKAATLCRLGKAPAVIWTEQVHGIQVAELIAPCVEVPVADAAWTEKTGLACVVMTADCLPVLFCDDKGSKVAVAHAGWRGLLNGVLEATIEAMCLPAHRLLTYLGPAIGPDAFEVGSEVRSAFVQTDPEAACAFKPAQKDKWLADIYHLARLRLSKKCIENIDGGNFCTVNEKERFFSYRRDGITGRMAAMIWLDEISCEKTSHNDLSCKRI